MHAVAAALLGYGPDAEDAVQKASIVALRRIGDIRDPGAVGPWLPTVVRNVCRAMLRRTSGGSRGDRRARPAGAVHRARPGGADRAVRAAGLDRERPGAALPGLRLAMLLRSFTEATSYEDIAAVSTVPLGTVRSPGQCPGRR